MSHFDQNSQAKNTVEILEQTLKIKESQENFSEALEDAKTLYELTHDSKWKNQEQTLHKSLSDKKLHQEAGEFLMIFKANSEIKPGSQWHVVSMKWFNSWQSYVQIGLFFMEEEIPFKLASRSLTKSENPGIIDNTDIIDFEQTAIILTNPEQPDNKITLKKGIAENFDYILMPAPAYEFLYNIYNCSTDIKRYAIEINSAVYQVEVTLKMISLACYLNMELDTNLMNVSAKDSIGKVKKDFLAVRKYGGASKVWKVNLQVVSMDKLLAIIKTNETVCLQGAKILGDQQLIDDSDISEQDLLFIETPRINNFLLTENTRLLKDRCYFCQSSSRLSTICPSCKSAKYCSLLCLEKHKNDHKPFCRPRNRSLLRCFCRSSPNDNSDEDNKIFPIDSVLLKKQGLVGLQNLGNTCFMNAAIQCLSHTNELTEFLLNGKFTDLINKNNPLGTNGKLVLAYAELLQVLWKGSNLSIAPWKMKRTISSFAPQFVGYQQQDAQELLGFLLDRIHEDLNQVKKKPYFEENEFLLNSDEEMAKESWRRHVLRNQSLIVDLMHGQYKSTVLCPECNKNSITFDPFNSITLPLPQSQEKTLNFYYIFYDSEKPPFNMAVEYLQGQTMDHVKKEICYRLPLSETSFIFASILNDYIKEILKENRTIDSLKNFTVFAYGLKDVEDFETLELRVSIEKGKVKGTSYSRILNIKKNSSYKELHLEVFWKFKRHFNKPATNKKLVEVYEEFMENPAFTINFVVTKDLICQFCKDPNCKGCPVPYSNEKLTKLFAGARVIIEILWKLNHSAQGANISDLNRCTEHESVSQILTKSKSMPVKLEDCFQLFGVPEKLEKENAWYCSNCKTHVLATKKLEIYKVPSILIVHIKRFRANGHSKEKLYNPVEFPLTGLDVRKWVIGESDVKLYDLYAVCNHFGNLSGGHYTASCYSVLNSSWFDFKDSQVVPSTDESNAASAYVLFYRARQ